MAGQKGGGGGQENGSNTEMLLLVTVILVALGAWVLWTFARAAIVLPAFVIDYALVFIIEHTKGIGDVGSQVKDFIAAFFTGRRQASTDITWEQFAMVRDLVHSQLKWVFSGIIAVLAAIVMFRMKGQGFKRRFSLGGGKGQPQSLAHYQSERWKVATYSAYFDPDGRDKHITQAATPMEFLRDNGIPYENGIFTEDVREGKLKDVFVAQLGAPWNGIERANLNVQTVLILCALHYLRRKNALAEREALSVAWAQGRDGTAAMKSLVERYLGPEKDWILDADPLPPARGKDGKPVSAKPADAAATQQKTQAAPAGTEKKPAAPKEVGDKDVRKVIKSICSKHAYANPGAFALLDKARARGGVLASADFGYIKQLDRTLWYTLSNCGRRRFFIEAAGAVAHFFAERVTENPLVDANVENALNGVEDYLEEQGLDSLSLFFKEEDALGLS